MQQHFDRQGQPIGSPMENWQGCPFPDQKVMSGDFCRLEPLDPQTHADDLFEAFALSEGGGNWTYLLSEPFDDVTSFNIWLEEMSQSRDPLFFTIVDQKTGTAVGVASYLRIQPEQGVIEVGHLHFSPKLQKKPAATEAMYLMMNHAFDLGYRRYEWKCDSLNAPSRKAALRLGFTFEGIFRQAMVYKNRNRDTAWFSITDQEWPALKQRFEHWLDADNFDANGIQRQSLGSMISG